MLRFDPVEHKYWWGDVEIPGVSRLLEPLKGDGYKFVKPHLLDYSQRLGTQVHLMTHQYDTGKYVDTLLIDTDIYDDAMYMFESYVKWIKGKEVLDSELMVYYKQSGEVPKYGGQLDKRIRFGGGWRVVDLKCTSKVEDYHGLQSFMYESAYMTMLRTDTGIVVEHVMPAAVLRLQKKGAPCYWEIKTKEKELFRKRRDMLITKYWYWDKYKDRRGLIKRR
jgi:hypothetical protein